MTDTGIDLAAAARSIIGANVYMTLGTTGDDGRPWVSPVYHAANGFREFYRISDPEAAHSQSLARRPHASLVIFDSRQAPGTGQAGPYT
jgi:Pyridoxamine 5'-phosphate oxidase